MPSSARSRSSATRRLRGKAFAVGGRPESRGVVASASYMARKFGVHSAMPMAQAVRLCPDLLVVPPNFAAYRAASQQVMAAAPRAHAAGRADLDRRGVSRCDRARRSRAILWRRSFRRPFAMNWRCPARWAWRQTSWWPRLRPMWARAWCAAARCPRRSASCRPATRRPFLRRCPPRRCGVLARRTAEKLAELGIHTIGDIAAWPAADLARRFGQHGEDLARRARGIDDRPIVTERAAKSISQETTFARDVTDRATLERTLREQAAEIAQKLRRDDLMGTTVKLKIRWPDFTTPTRQLTLPQPTDEAEDDRRGGAAAIPADLAGRAGGAADRRGRERPGLAATPAQPVGSPAAPTPEEQARQQRVEAALAAIQARFGAGAVRRGSELEEL